MPQENEAHTIGPSGKAKRPREGQLESESPGPNQAADASETPAISPEKLEKSSKRFSIPVFQPIIFDKCPLPRPLASPSHTSAHEDISGTPSEDATRMPSDLMKQEAEPNRLVSPEALGNPPQGQQERTAPHDAERASVSDTQVQEADADMTQSVRGPEEKSLYWTDPGYMDEYRRVFPERARRLPGFLSPYGAFGYWPPIPLKRSDTRE